MRRFKSAGQAQRFLSVHDQVANLFHIAYPETVTADFRRVSRQRAFWRDVQIRRVLTKGTSDRSRPCANHPLKLTVP